MKTAHRNQPIPRGEAIEETLTRLSANIATLSGLMDEAESRGRIHLARMFTAARATRVAEARKEIALAREIFPTGNQGLRTPVPIVDLPLQAEARQWQRAVNEGWRQAM